MRLFVVIQILLCLSSARFLWGESSPAEEEAIRKLRGKVSNLQRNRDETVRFVRFSKPIVTNEDVSRIKAFKQLDYLAVVTSQVTDAGLESLKHLTKLDTLLLADSGITDATLKTIGQLPKLQRLYLDRTKITDQGLADLTNLTSLQVLSVSDTKITDAGLVHLTSLKNLETIYLCKTQISDNGLLQLAQLSNIKHLFLDQTRLTGTGLKHLALLENLELLSLRGVALNPTALNTSVDLKKLKTLLLNNTGLNKGDLTDISNKVNVTLSPEEDEKLSAFEKFRNNIPLDSVPSHDDGEAASVLQAGLIEPISLRLTQTDIIPDFQRHVIPLLGRLGCNGRSCHGSFQGQGGFSLSMFGYDFGHDHEAITSGENPRIDLVSPDESLVIYKPTHEDDHGGGQRFELGSWQHQLIYRWIKSGAKGIVDQPHRIISFQVTPSSVTFSSPGETAQLQCVATWENGVQEDVTPLTRFQSNDTAISEVSEDGLITCISPGDTNIISFYDIKVSSTEVMLPVNQKAGADFPHVETPTRIDQLVVNKLSKLGIVPSELCSDEEFLRRVSIDIAGTLPTPEKIEQFLNDTSPDKRENVIDELIESPAYADWWSIKLADLTGSNSQYLGTTDMNTPAAIQWNQWLRRRVQDNAGWDEIVAGIILSSSRQPGETYEEYAAAQSKFLKGKDPEDFTDPKNSMHYYWFRSNNQLPSDRALSFGYVFMGVRLQCAQCHKHPFDQWSKDDFDKFTQFFHQSQSWHCP